MKTFYTFLLAILLPNIICLANTNHKADLNSYDEFNITNATSNSGDSYNLSLPQIICPQNIDTILPSRRDCGAAIEYNVGFDDANCPISQFNLAQNFSDANISAFSCSAEVETSHLRVYDLSQSGLPTQVFLTGVDVGVGFASEEPEITINLYTLQGEFIYANMTLLESYKAIVPVLSGGIFTVPIDLLVSNTDMIVVELVAPSFDQGQIPGYNIGGGQSAPSYIASPGCSIDEPVDMASFGQPDFNLVLKLRASNFSIQQTAGLESGEVFPAGTTTNTFVLTDPNGASDECSFDVNVSFGEAPFLICPPNINTTSQEGVCGAIVDFDVFILETCDGDSIYQIVGIPSGGEFPLGFTRNEYVAVDMFGGRDTCRFDVFVEDVIAPTIECLDDIIVTVDDAACGSIVEFDLIVNDFCTSPQLNQTSGIPSGFNFPVGVTTNSYMAIDEAGNSSQCSFNIIVEDGSELSFVNCPDDIIIETSTADCGAIANYELPEVSGGDCDSIPIAIRQNISNQVISSYGCDQSIESRHLRVFDMPKMGVNGDFLIEFMEIGIGFADENDPQIDINIYNLDAQELLYENMTLVFSQQYLLPTLADTTRLLTINHMVPRGQKVVIEAVVPEDNTSRFIAGYSNQGEFRESYYAAPACGFDEPISLSDIGIDLALVMELQGSVTNNRLVSQTAGLPRGALFPIGTTTNTFSLEDGSTCSFDVTIVDGTAPTIECPADVTMNILGNSCDTMVMIDLPTAEDNCGTVSISNSINMMENATDIYANGITPVTYLATDLAGNTSTCNMNVIVNGSLGVDIQTVDVSCAEGNDGQILIDITSGTPPYSYTWNNGQITEDLSNLTAGTYDLTIQDGSQCSFEATVVIFEPTPLVLENLLVNNSVNDQDNGNINLDIVGGTPGYTYAWSNNDNEANITNLSPGTYTCTVTDALGCELEVGPFEIEGVVATKSIADIAPPMLYPNPANETITVLLNENQSTPVEYQIINPLGITIASGSIANQSNGTNIEVSTYTNGIYFLLLKNKKGQSSTSFVVQH